MAAGALVGIGVILFLRRVREPGFRWRPLGRPLLWTAAVAGAGLANGWPVLFRLYDTEKPMSLFRFGLVVSLVLSLLGLLLVACVGFVLLGAARPGWGAALRRRGTLTDAVFRAAVTAAIVLGIARWFHVVSARIPALYDPDPTLPASLVDAVPAVNALWAAGRGLFGLAAVAAAAALAWRSTFFRSAAGRALGILGIVLTLMPTDLRSPAEFSFEIATALVAAGWVAVCVFGLLREHAAAWVLFGLAAFGGRAAIELLAQPAAEDRSAGALAVLLLFAAAVALLAGRRDAAEATRAAPPPI